MQVSHPTPSYTPHTLSLLFGTSTTITWTQKHFFTASQAQHPNSLSFPRRPFFNRRAHYLWAYYFSRHTTHFTFFVFNLLSLSPPVHTVIRLFFDSNSGNQFSSDSCCCVCAVIAMFCADNNNTVLSQLCHRISRHPSSSTPFYCTIFTDRLIFSFFSFFLSPALLSRSHGSMSCCIDLRGGSLNKSVLILLWLKINFKINQLLFPLFFSPNSFQLLSFFLIKEQVPPSCGIPLPCLVVFAVSSTRMLWVWESERKCEVRQKQRQQTKWARWLSAAKTLAPPSQSNLVLDPLSPPDSPLHQHSRVVRRQQLPCTASISTVLSSSSSSYHQLPGDGNAITRRGHYDWLQIVSRLLLNVFLSVSLCH